MRVLARQQTKEAECFAHGMKFEEQIRRADHFLGEAEESVERIENDLSEEGDMKKADESLIDAMAAMMEAQRAIAETDCLPQFQKDPFILALQRAINAVKDYTPVAGAREPFAKVDFPIAFQELIKVENIMPGKKVPL